MLWTAASSSVGRTMPDINNNDSEIKRIEKWSIWRVGCLNTDTMVCRIEKLRSVGSGTGQRLCEANSPARAAVWRFCVGTAPSVFETGDSVSTCRRWTG